MSHPYLTFYGMFVVGYLFGGISMILISERHRRDP